MDMTTLSNSLILSVFQKAKLHIYPGKNKINIDPNMTRIKFRTGNHMFKIKTSIDKLAIEKNSNLVNLLFIRVIIIVSKLLNFEKSITDAIIE